MTTQVDSNGHKQVTFSIRELIPIGSGIAGFVALIGFLSFWAVIPERVNKLELNDREQAIEIRSIRDDNAQRREMLAAALATLQQIDDRTKRLEDHLIK
jgi:hypothetical protein